MWHSCGWGTEDPFCLVLLCFCTLLSLCIKKNDLLSRSHPSEITYLMTKNNKMS